MIGHPRLQASSLAPFLVKNLGLADYIQTFMVTVTWTIFLFGLSVFGACINSGAVSRPAGLPLVVAVLSRCSLEDIAEFTNYTI